MSGLEKVFSHDVINPATTLGALVYALLFFIIALVASILIRTSFRRLDRHGVLERTSSAFVVQFLQIACFVLAFVLYAHLVPKLRALGTALLASVSVISVVLGLAAQNTLGNLIAGISLLLYRPFEVGDRVKISAPGGTEVGVVERLNLGYTLIQTFDNRRLVVPNSVIASQVMVNYTAMDPKHLARIPIGISYNSDIDRAREILLDLAANHPLIREVVGCPLIQLGDSSVVLDLRGWCASALDAKKIEFDIYESAKKRFDEAGIEIPFPHRTLYLRRDAAGDTGAGADSGAAADSGGAGEGIPPASGA